MPSKPIECFGIGAPIKFWCTTFATAFVTGAARLLVNSDGAVAIAGRAAGAATTVDVFAVATPIWPHHIEEKSHDNCCFVCSPNIFCRINDAAFFRGTASDDWFATTSAFIASSSSNFVHSQASAASE